MASFTLVPLFPVLAALAAECGSYRVPAPAPSASGAVLVVRPSFPTLAAAASFARLASARCHRSVAVRRVPEGWAASVPCAPAGIGGRGWTQP